MTSHSLTGGESDDISWLHQLGLFSKVRSAIPVNKACSGPLDNLKAEIRPRHELENHVEHPLAETYCTGSFLLNLGYGKLIDVLMFSGGAQALRVLFIILPVSGSSNPWGCLGL